MRKGAWTRQTVLETGVRAVLVPRTDDVAGAEQLGGAPAGEDDLAAEHAGEDEEADEKREGQLGRRRPQAGLERDGRDDQRALRDLALFIGHARDQIRVSVEERDRMPARRHVHRPYQRPPSHILFVIAPNAPCFRVPTHNAARNTYETQRSAAGQAIRKSHIEHAA